MKGRAIHIIMLIIPSTKPIAPKAFESSLTIPTIPKAIAAIGSAVNAIYPNKNHTNIKDSSPNINEIIPNIFPKFSTFSYYFI